MSTPGLVGISRVEINRVVPTVKTKTAAEEEEIQGQLQSQQREQFSAVHSSLRNLSIKISEAKLESKVAVELKIARNRMQAVGLVLGLPNWELAGDDPDNRLEAAPTKD